MILNGKEQRHRRECGDMRGLNNPAVGVSDWPDIGCGLAGPGTKNGMGVRPGMLMVTSGRGRMGEGTTRSDERQRQIQHSDPEGHDGGGSFNGQSIHGSTIFPGYSSTPIEETCLPTDAHGCYTIIQLSAGTSATHFSPRILPATPFAPPVPARSPTVRRGPRGPARR